MLRAIQNFHHSEIMLSARSLQIDQSSIGSITDKGLQFKSEEIEFITRNYRELYSNRLDKIAKDNNDTHL